MTSPRCHPRSVGALAIGYGMHPLDEVPYARRVDLGGGMAWEVEQTPLYLNRQNISFQKMPLDEDFGKFCVRYY